MGIGCSWLIEVWGWSLMFFVLLNEDQTPGSLAKAPHPRHPPHSHPLPLGAEGQQILKDQFYLKRGRLFSLLFPLDFLSLPLFLLISVSGTQSMSASRSEFITSLRRPWPRWIRPLKSSHQHLREAEGAGWETSSATRHRKHTDGGGGSA